MYIVFDTETTGLPENFNAPITDFNNWPRIVQLAWKVYDIQGNVISTHNRIVKPDGFIIPPESISIHRITNERANSEGLPLKEVLNEFINSIKHSKFLVAHNINFDNKITGCEFLRMDMHNYMNDIIHVCTMNSTVDFCRIQGGMGLKSPTLTELHNKLFGKPFEDAHDALIDVEALGRCFFKLKEIDVLGFDEYSLQYLDSREQEVSLFERWSQKNVLPESPVPMVNFGVHTYNSILQGAASAGDYVKKAKEFKHDTIVLTDRGNMSGSFSFYQKCKSEKIKPVIGCEFYLNDSVGGEFEEKIQDTNVLQKIIIRNKQGFSNINRLNYLSFTEGYYRVPRIKNEWIIDNKDGLILTTTSKNGIISKYIQQGKYKLAERYLQKMIDIFGKQSYIAEISLEDNQIQRQYNKFMINMAHKYGMALILSNEVYYSKKEDSILQDVLISIDQKKSIKKSRIKENRNMYYVSEEMLIEMNHDFHFNYSEDFLKMCLITSHRIASVCDFEFETDIEKYPEYKPTEDIINYFKTENVEEIISKLAHAKLNQKLKIYENKGPVKLNEQKVQEYRNRLDYEIDVIKEKKMIDYFLVVWDLIRYCGENDIEVGPGRGSAAGSLLSWCLDITKIDPLRFDLYFERFLNPERKCLTSNCSVMLKDGTFKSILDVEVGDPVQTEHGLGVLVQKHERELKDDECIFEIETEEGVKIELTADHIIPVLREGKRIEIRVDEILNTDSLYVF